MYDAGGHQAAGIDGHCHDVRRLSTTFPMLSDLYRALAIAIHTFAVLSLGWREPKTGKLTLANVLIVISLFSTILITAIPLYRYQEGIKVYGKVGYCTSSSFFRPTNYFLISVRVLDYSQPSALVWRIPLDVAFSWPPHHPIHRQLCFNAERFRLFQEETKHFRNRGRP